MLTPEPSVSYHIFMRIVIIMCNTLIVIKIRSICEARSMQDLFHFHTLETYYTIFDPTVFGMFIVGISGELYA